MGSCSFECVLLEFRLDQGPLGKPKGPKAIEAIRCWSWSRQSWAAGGSPTPRLLDQALVEAARFRRGLKAQFICQALAVAPILRHDFVAPACGT